MRTFGKTILAFGALCLLAGQAQAQQGGGMGMGGGAQLYVNPSVQKELKFTEEQTTKARTVMADLREKYQEKITEARESQDFAQMQKLNLERNAEAKKAMADVLKPDQIKRFGQIQMQQMGAMAFQNADVLQKITLTDDQKSKVKEITDDLQAQRRELFQGFQDDREGTLKKMATLNKETNEKALAVLTDEQKKTWKEMTGEPFEVKYEAPR
jgi:Spy/CpxP family protein refolding chaperone